MKQKRADLEKLIGHLELLSEEDIAALQQQHTTLKQAVEHLNQSEKVLENDLKWHRQQHYLYTEIQAKKKSIRFSWMLNRRWHRKTVIRSTGPVSADSGTVCPATAVSEAA